MTYEEFLDGCNKEARDNNRTPIQWDDSVNAGFNKGAKPWLKINENYTTINAASQINDENSIYNFYRKLLSLRKSDEYVNTFVYGKFNEVHPEIKNIFAYIREDENHKVLVVTNMKDNHEKINLDFKVNKTLLSNYNKEYDSLDITLAPFESFVVEVK